MLEQPVEGKPPVEVLVLSREAISGEGPQLAVNPVTPRLVLYEQVRLNQLLQRRPDLERRRAGQCGGRPGGDVRPWVHAAEQPEQSRCWSTQPIVRRGQCGADCADGVAIRVERRVIVV
ncbi:hypothetical protein [Dactylosporangium cerinum]